MNAIGRLQQEELDVVRLRDKVCQQPKHYEATGAHHHGPSGRKNIHTPTQFTLLSIHVIDISIHYEAELLSGTNERI